MSKPKPALEAVEDADAEPETNDGDAVEMVDVPFRGHNFKIPRDMDEWDTEACLAMSQQEYVLAAKLILGGGQWALLQSLGSKRKDVREFLIIFGDVVGRECTA